MPRMQRDMVIAACQVAPAPAIPDRDKDEIWNGRRELALPYAEKSHLRAVSNLLE
jgi:hypothetical protein